MDQQARRTALQAFARLERHNPNRCEALTNIVGKAAELVEGEPHPANAMVEDLEQVIIGRDMLGGRGNGPFFAGNFRGAQGFRQDLQDPYNQVQHAVAGVVIGFRHNQALERIVYMLEEECVRSSGLAHFAHLIWPTPEG